MSAANLNPRSLASWSVSTILTKRLSEEQDCIRERMYSKDRGCWIASLSLVNCVGYFCGKDISSEG